MNTTADALILEAACALGETSYEWSQPEAENGRWQAVVNDQREWRYELSAALVADGVEISTTLAEWESDLAETSGVAIALFLETAHEQIRGARFQQRYRDIRVVSFAPNDRLDVELPNSVASVVAASGLMWREVRALANESVAGAYLRDT